MGAIESVHNDQPQPVEVWWDLLDGQIMDHQNLQPGETGDQELTLSLLHKICVKQNTQVVCQDLLSPALAGKHVTYQVTDILTQTPVQAVSETSGSVGSDTGSTTHILLALMAFGLLWLYGLKQLRRKHLQKSDGPRQLEESLIDSEGQTGSKDKTRFICACIGAVLIHLTLGTFYSWGNITPYVTSYLKSQGHDVSYGETSFVLAFASFFQGLSMFFGGKFQSKLGLRGTALLGGGVLSLGTALSFFTVQYGLFPFLFTYSAMFGTGIGLAYTAPLVTLFGWLPNNKGLASGIVVGGFGMGSFVFSFAQKAWVNPSGLAPGLKLNGLMYYSADAPILGNVPSLFLLLAFCYFTMQVIGVALLFPAPPSLVSSQSSIMDPTRQFSASQMVRTCSFWIIAGCFFFNQQVNIFFSSFEQVFGASLLQGGVSTQFLTVMAACASLCNGAGRIAWGSVCDKYSFKTAITSLCAIQMLLAATIAFCRTEDMYFVWVCSILFNVGGFYALFPAACAIYFGQANVGSNYGILSIAPGVSALWSAFLASELTQIFPVVYLTFLVAALEFGAFMCALYIPSKPETVKESSRLQEFTVQEAANLQNVNPGGVKAQKV
eukprot:gnl/MRDRNA2_/MRDRNA2_114905_c0_seq1.p1 gnl/MRDRNA2_/MRDRNA2_114905_c0~~gnl/MRDRNA2_/MRDRNA2_114905_c0_seq1.p1  ORF type:complete len:607 (+),score=100.29 gnl/MRDRNA2_/MRDRNA2_114905_c0_seq1:97-1917(+)